MKIQKTKNLYGLVLIGGKSTRMKKDKGLLSFHDRPQAVYAYELLDQFCEKTFVSCRKEQGREKLLAGLAQIHDNPGYEGKGPLAGILSAMEIHPKATWLVLACDLPFVQAATLDELLRNRRTEKIATAFRSAHDGLPEPLCAVYEAHGLAVLQDFFQNDMHCPRKIMMNSEVALIDPTDPAALDNINRPDEYEKARAALNERKLHG